MSIKNELGILANCVEVLEQLGFEVESKTCTQILEREFIAPEYLRGEGWEHESSIYNEDEELVGDIFVSPYGQERVRVPASARNPYCLPNTWEVVE